MTYRPTFLEIVLAALVAMVLLVGHMLGSAAFGATVNGSYVLPTQYEDGSALPVANIRHITVEVGTCSGTAFGTVEGTENVPPPATTFAVTVPRAFGDFCARLRTVTTLGTVSAYTAPAKVTRVEPAPKPPTWGVVNVVAYEVLSHPIEGTRLGRNVGTVPVGTACGDEPIVYTSRGEYREVGLDAVTLKRMPRSAIVVAQCKAG